MEPLDSEEFDKRERRDARQNAYEIKGNVLKLVRIFQRKQMQDKLNKEFNIPKQNEVSNFFECFEDVKKLWHDKLKTPVEETKNIKQMLEGLRQKTTTLKQTCLKKDEQFTKTKDNNKDQKAQLNRDKVALEESSN